MRLLFVSEALAWMPAGVMRLALEYFQRWPESLSLLPTAVQVRACKRRQGAGKGGGTKGSMGLLTKQAN